MDLQHAMTKASDAGKVNHCVRMLKANLPDDMILAAVGCSAGFLAKARSFAGLGARNTDHGRLEHADLRQIDAVKVAKANRDRCARTLCKSLKLTLGKGRPNSQPGGIIANVIRKQHAEGSSYEQIALLLNPDHDADGIKPYTCKAVCEYGETLV